MIKFTFILLSLCWLAVGCVSHPTAQFDRNAESIGLTRAEVTAGQFDLAVYRKGDMQSDELHIYIGGDGSPWHTPTVVKFDPTQIYPVVLELAEVDTATTVVLGRPCYHHAGRGRNCDSRWWTSHRYAADVIDSMAEAMRELISAKDYRSVTLIGFSGGGTLAWLLSRELEGIDKLITLAGNLDIDHWTRQHSYTPLFGSLNPANNLEQKEFPPERILQLHLFGQDDRNIDGKHIKQLLSGHKNTISGIVPGFSHRCCWSTVWPDVLSATRQSNSAAALHQRLDQVVPAWIW